MSRVIETIIGQLKSQGLDRLKLATWGFELFVKMDDHTLRLHFKSSGRIMNIDIRYNDSLDLYEIAAHRINPKTLDITTRIYTDIYFDQFAELIPEILKVEE
jgi:hypothetical protein